MEYHFQRISYGRGLSRIDLDIEFRDSEKLGPKVTVSGPHNKLFHNIVLELSRLGGSIVTVHSDLNAPVDVKWDRPIDNKQFLHHLISHNVLMPGEETQMAADLNIKPDGFDQPQLG